MILSKFVDALSQVKIEGTENPKYALLNVTNSKVNVIDLEDYKAYAFDYAVTTEDENDSLVIDFESKCEMSLSACEKISEEGFNEFSIADTITSRVEKETEEKLMSFTEKLNSEFDAKLQEIKAQYDELDKNYTEAMKELNVFRASDNKRKEEEHKQAIDAIVNEFAKKLEKVPEFLVYKARLDYSKSIDEVSKDLTLMAGKSLMDKTKANFSYSPVSTVLSNKANKSQTTERYGHLLDKYKK